MSSSVPIFLIKDGAQSWPEIAAMRTRIYPPEKLVNTPMYGIEWAAPQRRVLLYVDNNVAAVAGIHEREILCDGKVVSVAGIGGVMTDPDHQGQGYGRQVMLQVMQLLRIEAGCAFAMLFCEDHNIGFYSKLGWCPFEGDMVAEQYGKTGRFVFQNVMVLPLSEPEKRNANLDLCGLPW